MAKTPNSVTRMEPLPFREPPVIPRLRTIRNIVKFVRNPIPILDRYIRENGNTFCLYLGAREKTILTANAHVIQYILQKRHRNFQKSPLQIDQVAHFIGRGLLTIEGPYWLQQRRLIQPEFHRAKLAGLTDIMLEEVDRYMDELEKRTEVNHTIDVSRAMMELTFNIVAKALFSTGIEKEAINQINQSVNQVQSFLVRQIRQPFLMGWFKLSGEQKKYEDIAGGLKQMILNIIRERKAESGHYNDLLDMLFQARYEDTGQGMDDQQLLAESLILMVAGHETSANALAWTWYLLCQHPDVVEKIRKEIREVLGQEKPTFETLAKLEYINMVLQESMRLYPPAWITDRVPMEDDACEGFELPKGRVIGLYIYGVHRSSEYWTEPDQFDPLRFTKEEIKKRPPYAYLPFGGGPRLCIGSNFAMMEMKLVIVRMLQRFDLELVENQLVEQLPLITLGTKKGILVRLNPWKG